MPPVCSFSSITAVGVRLGRSAAGAFAATLLTTHHFALSLLCRCLCFGLCLSLGLRFAFTLLCAYLSLRVHAYIHTCM